MAPPVLAEAGKFRALVYVLSVDETAARTELAEGRGARPGAGFALFTPTLSDRRTAAQALAEEAVQGVHALAVFVASVALFLSHVQALGS